MPTLKPLAPERDIYTVTRLNREARSVLEGNFPLLWLEAEISNLARPSSGHWYFSLKDPSAQVRAAMFRNRNQLLRFRPEDGMQVLVRARISLYEARGDYQLIVEHMEEAGDGALRRAFEELKQRLATEGLFAEAHKQEIPGLPRAIGVITSPTGAAIRDILSVLGRRFPAIPVIIYPVPVQGEGAGSQIANAIRTASERRDCDVLLVSRGGGSLEDLWAFNEEVVARAIYDCQIPVVSGVGHEVDITIADFVADERAATPSAAAERVSPDQAEWLAALRNLDNRLLAVLRRRQTEAGQRLAWLEKRLQQLHPGQRLRQQAQRLDELEQRLFRSRDNLHARTLATLANLRVRLQAQAPVHRIARLSGRHHELTQRLAAGVHLRLERQRNRLQGLARALDTVSPLATLERGYSITRHRDDRAILKTTAKARQGEQLETRLANGVIISTIDSIEPTEES